MVPVSLHGLTAVPSKVISMRIILKGKVYISGLMVESTKVTGKTTRWKDLDPLHGLMDAFMKVIILTIKKTAKEYSSGLMAESTRVTGKMASNTVLEITHRPQESQKKVNGILERESIG